MKVLKVDKTTRPFFKWVTERRKEIIEETGNTEYTMSVQDAIVEIRKIGGEMSPEWIKNGSDYFDIVFEKDRDYTLFMLKYT